LKRNLLSIVRLISCLLLLALLLSACQFTPAGDQPTATKVLKSATPQPPLTSTATSVPSITPTFPADVQRLKGMKVVFWHPWMGDLEAALQSEVEEFNQTNAWGLKVELKGFGGSAALESAFLAAESTQLPTMLLGSPEQLADLQSQTGSLLDLSVLVDDPEWGLTPGETSDFLPGLWPPFKTDGNTPGLPLLNNARVLIYNRSWAKELGFTNPPETPEDFSEQVCAAMQANLSAVYTLRGSGGWLLDNDAYTLLGWLQGFGAEFSDELKFNTSEGLATFTYLRQLVDEDCTYRLTVASPEPYETFATRKALVYAGSLADLPMQTQVSNKLNITDQWEVIPFPALNGEGVVPIFTQDVAIVDGTHEQELGAWLFVRWLLLSRNQVGLAQIGGMLPVTQSGLDALRKLTLPIAQQKAVLNLAQSFRPLQTDARWSVARRVLEDAAWQLYQPYTKVENIPSILEQLDALVGELQEK
jgi:multiple sugar transport system substrate-binding protein